MEIPQKGEETAIINLSINFVKIELKHSFLRFGQFFLENMQSEIVMQKEGMVTIFQKNFSLCR